MSDPPGRKGRRLPPDDKAVWERVTQNVKPLARPVRPKPQPVDVTPTPVLPPSRRPTPAAPSPRPQALETMILSRARRTGPPPIEDRMLKAIRRGQSPIDMRLDLHGETQIRAHRLLERALAAGQARGARIVLIVTGTGLRRRLESEKRAPGEEAPGVLRRMLPQWLATPPFVDWVLGVSPAAQHHGGSGAFYVLLRRQRVVD